MAERSYEVIAEAGVGPYAQGDIISSDAEPAYDFQFLLLREDVRDVTVEQPAEAPEQPVTAPAPPATPAEAFPALHTQDEQPAAQPSVQTPQPE